MRALIRGKRFGMATDEYSLARFENLRGHTIALGFTAVFLLWGLWAWAWSIAPAHAPDTLGWFLVMGALLAIYPIALLSGLSLRALPWLLYALLMAAQGMFLYILVLLGAAAQGSAGFLFWFLAPPLLAFIFGWRINLTGSLVLLLFPNLLVAVFGKFSGFDLLQFNLLALPAMTIALFVSHLADQWLRQIHDLHKQIAWRNVAIASSGEALLVTGRNGRIEHVNPAFTGSTGYTPEEVIGNKPSLLKSGFHDSAFYETMWTTLLNGQVWRGEIINRHKDDTSITLWTNIFPVAGRDGSPEKFVALSSDITSRRQLEEEVALGNAELEAIFTNAGVGIALLDSWGRFIKANDFWLSMFGYSREETIASLNHTDISNDDDVVDHRHLFVALASGELPSHHSDRRFVCNGGRVFWGHISMTPVKNEAGYIRAIIAIVQDIDERKLLKDKLESMAHYDALTGLPNRALFFDRLGQAITQSKRSQGQFALMFVDLDGFKAVNDTFGHDTGDALLKAVSEHLLECVRESDTVARMGGDEFTIILRAIRGQEDAAHVAEKILATLSHPYHLLGHECRIGASLGIVLYPRHGKNAEDLLSQADNAMYAVKKAGKNAYRFAEDNSA
ncbi:MAG: diguanylate cyclase [Sulfuricella sp.]|jgi:GGDEF domain-containing protein